MKHVDTRSKETVVFFDPFARKPARPSAGPYSPYFQATPLQRPPHHVVEPAKKIDSERE